MDHAFYGSDQASLVSQRIGYSEDHERSNEASTPTAQLGCTYWSLMTSTSLVAILSASFSIIFCFAYNNYFAGMWALASATFGMAAMHMHVLNLFDRLFLWHDKTSLAQVKALGIGISALSTISGLIFSILAYSNHDAFDFGANNFMIHSYSAALSLLCGILLTLTATYYRSVLEAHRFFIVV